MKYYAVFKNGKPVVEEKSLFVFISKRAAADALLESEKETVVEVTITKKEEK